MCQDKRIVSETISGDDKGKESENKKQVILMITKIQPHMLCGCVRVRLLNRHISSVKTKV